MLHWLQKKVRSETKFFLLVSTVLHVIIVGLFFFVYKTGPDLHLLLIGSHTKDTIVRVLPLGAIKPRQRTGASVPAESGVCAASLQQPSSKQKVQKGKKTGKTHLAQKKLQTKNKKKAKDAKRVAAQEVPANTVSTVSDSNKASTSSLVTAKNEAVGNLAAEKSTAGPAGVEAGNDSMAPLAEENTLYVTQKEFEVLELQQHLQEAIEQVWTAPMGVDKDLFCDVQVYVDQAGKIVDPVFVTRTGVHIYDSAVEDALELLVLPKSLWGRSIVIVFKP